MFATVDVRAGHARDSCRAWMHKCRGRRTRRSGNVRGYGTLLHTLNRQIAVRGAEPSDIATVKPISYQAADGMQISGYLTLSNSKSSKYLPLIVMPHGGPAARDDLDFDWFAQALASRGYLVLQPNFRGSWGLGLTEEEAGYGEYGRKMQTDLSDGVRALVKLVLLIQNACA